MRVVRQPIAAEAAQCPRGPLGKIWLQRAPDWPLRQRVRLFSELNRSRRHRPS